jgi:hypothetical protein
MQVPTTYIRVMRALIVVCAALTTPCAVFAQARAQHSIVFDSYMTPAAGAEDLLTVQHVLTSAEDRWLPLKIGEERSRPALALGILYRSAKFFALDMPQDHFFLVLAHEVFGHGARFRELGEGRLRYGFDAPIPYGSGDAFTSFNGSFPTTPLAEVTASASGIEAQHSLADSIAARAVASGRLGYREGWLYFESRLAAVSYILSASPTSSEGHDVADILDAFERACTAPCVPLRRHDVQRRALLALADPLLYYSIYGLAVSYIGNGETTGPVPLIPTGGAMRVMPSLGYTLTPYGEEWTLRTAFRQEERAESAGPRITGITLRLGNTGASSTWGITARTTDVLRAWRLRVGLKFDLWRQPELLAERMTDALETGIGAVATTVVPMPTLLRSRWSDGIHVAAGYKSQGFVPGEHLSGGAVLRVGLTVR